MTGMEEFDHAIETGAVFEILLCLTRDPKEGWIYRNAINGIDADYYLMETELVTGHGWQHIPHVGMYYKELGYLGKH